jgi:hypothetical protein
MSSRKQLPERRIVGAELITLKKEQAYFDDLYDMLDENALHLHPAYNAPVHLSSSSSSPPRTPGGVGFADADDLNEFVSSSNRERTSSSPPRTPLLTNRSSASRGSSNRAASPAKSPAYILEHLEDKLVSPEAAIDPETGEIDYNRYVGYSTREQVAENVRTWVKEVRNPKTESELPFSRCVVCTLPFGTCEHTRDWLKYDAPRSTEALL